MEGRAAAVSLREEGGGHSEPLSPGPVFPFHQDTLGKWGLMNPHLLFHRDLQAPRGRDTIHRSDSSIPSHGPEHEAVRLKLRVHMPLSVLLSPAFPPCDASLALPSNLLQLLFARRVQAGSLTLLPVRYFSKP